MGFYFSPTPNPLINAFKFTIFAGWEFWPRLFHNLRSSCETELLEKFPTPVVARWMGHDARGLIRPATKKSKQKLLAEMKDLYDQGKEYQKIGAVVGLCARSVKPLLKDYLATLGIQMPDGRSRK
jgi:hypothetical protein